MDTLEPKDESYWKDSNGEVNAEGHELANAYRKYSPVKYRVRDDGLCTCCFNNDEKKGPIISRSLKKIAETKRGRLEIRLCEVCDGDAFNISTSH